MKYMALDVGDRRIGVAVSDESGTVVTPLAVIERGSKLDDFVRIADLMRERDANGLVVGQPLNDDGSVTPQAMRIQRYTAALVDALRSDGLEFSLVFWDETLSSQRAQEIMIAAGRKATKRRARIDAVAAAVFLQDYLEVQRSSRCGDVEEGVL
jgi:putative Holliday junction resolvase